MSTEPEGAPWHGGEFVMPDDPDDADIRRAVRIVQIGGALSGNAMWTAAVFARLLRQTPPLEAVEAYRRVDAIVTRLDHPPNPVFGKAGRGMLHTRPLGRTGDVVPADATDEEIRALYPPGDADAIIKFREQLRLLSDTPATTFSHCGSTWSVEGEPLTSTCPSCGSEVGQTTRSPSE